MRLILPMFASSTRVNNKNSQPKPPKDLATLNDLFHRSDTYFGSRNGEPGYPWGALPYKPTRFSPPPPISTSIVTGKHSSKDKSDVTHQIPTTPPRTGSLRQLNIFKVLSENDEQPMSLQNIIKEVTNLDPSEGKLNSGSASTSFTRSLRILKHKLENTNYKLFSNSNREEKLKRGEYMLKKLN
jgi:hypothetical protein